MVNLNSADQFREELIQQGIPEADIDLFEAIGKKRAAGLADTTNIPQGDTIRSPAIISGEPIVTGLTPLPGTIPDTVPSVTNVRGGMSTEQGPIGGMSIAPTEPQVQSRADGNRIIPNKVGVTTRFGVSSSADVFSQGVNNGVDLAAPRGTPVSSPQGEWVVKEAFGGASREGFIGNGDNSGFGNSVLIQNTQTGETLRFSHLDGVKVKPGQRINGGQQLGISGNTGNSSGPHLDVEYRDSTGALRDVLGSRFKDLF
ncbi:MAG TPA: M23 family metallopeptidase [bacterium]|nr:M23 family metallopeptidase [bacterium]